MGTVSGLRAMASIAGVLLVTVCGSMSHGDPIRLGGDGLALVVDSETGALRALEVEGRDVLREPGGLYVQDVAAQSDAQAVRGNTTRSEDGSLAQRAEIAPIGMALATTYEAARDHIRVHCHLQDLRGEDRAIVVSYRLPMDAEGWTWGQDLVHSQRISADPQDPDYQDAYRAAVSIGAGAEGMIGRYPFSALSGPEYGLSYAIRMDEPRVFLMQYRNDLRCYEIRFSLGLSRATEKFPGQADVSFVIYRHGPRWGFRSAAQRYYDLFPEFFRVRVKRMGGWYCNTRDKALAKVKEAYDYNFAYHECSAQKPEAMQASNRLGIYTFHYTEPWFFHQILPTDFFPGEKPSVKGALDKLKHDMDPKNKGLFTRDAGAAHICEDALETTFDGFVRRQAHSVNNSMLWDLDGNPVTRGVVLYPHGQGKYRVPIPLNLDPDIPDGAGLFQKEWMMDPAYPKAEQLGAKLDGIYLDSHGVGEDLRNFRREHFRYVDTPLTFDTDTKHPCILNDFSAFEFCKWLAEDTWKQDRFLLVNYYHKKLFFNVIHWDAIGSEGYKRQEMLCRTLCYRKPYSDLAYGRVPKPLTPLYWREYLLYATFPGQQTGRRETYREIGSLVKREMAAGWEPVTLARCSDEDILIERYGRPADGNLHFAVQNSSEEMRSFRVQFSPELALSGSEIAYDLLNDRSYRVRAHEGAAGVDLMMLPGETTLLAVGAPRGVARGFVRQASTYWAEAMRVETYPSKAQVASSLERVGAMIAGGKKTDEVQQAVEQMRELWELKVSPQAHVAGLVEKAANVLSGLEIRVRAEDGDTPQLHAALSGIPQEEIEELDWTIQSPEGWQAEAIGGAATWRLTAPPPEQNPTGAHALTFRIQARVQTTDRRTHLLDKKIVRLASVVKGEQTQVLVSDDLEGEEPLKDWRFRAGGDVRRMLPQTGIMPEAARSGERGFRIDNSHPKGTVGFRSPMFREFAAGDFVRASAHTRQVEGAGVSLYLQCWKQPQGPNYYTMVKTQPCPGKRSWERVAIETGIPQGTTAISFEVYASRNRGIFDFDDVALVLFKPQEAVSWLGAE